MKGIDVSKHNGNIDWAKVKNSGIEFVIIRAGYGREVSQKDPKFEEYYAGAKSVGLPVGAYWYSYADSVEDASRELSACLSCIQGKTFDFPVYYDLEESSTAALGKDSCTKIAEIFCTGIEKAGYWAGIYANTNWFTNYLNHDYLSGKYTIWLADYRSNYNTTLKRDIHQYSSDGKVDGIPGRVDLNNCTRDFPKEINGTSTTVTPESTPTNTEIVVRCTGDRVNVRADAHTGAKVLTQAGKGNCLVWYADDGWGWSKIKCGTITGWISNKYLDKEGLSNYKVGESTGNRVNVRSGPGMNHSILRQVNKGNLFDIICILPNGWYHVNVAGQEGYITKDYVKVH